MRGGAPEPAAARSQGGGELDACGRATVPCFRGKRGGRVVLGRKRERDGQRGDEAGGEKMHLIKRLFIGICDARARASPGDDPEFSAARKWGLSIRRETGTLRFSLP